MADSMEKRAAKLQDSIRQVLYQDWNPIGIAGLPEDEYDGYIEPVYRILTGSRSEQELMDYLFRTARDTIGIACETAGHFKQMRPVARKLLELDVTV